ncbi:hypothetical protein BDN72DRAFT_960853 [Pluteus cervinus]|uniref:Uncharacterized protein n=1 Tax=Pluteus cervinus TaxID=181527 RepID=A0ACD3AQ23_9AGAR|nr:hypothetical protein BDN72DRAFT_960853 [Pluteus cervinus]
MGSICLSVPSILRCESFTSLQNQVLFIPSGVEVIVTSALLFSRHQSNRRHYLLVLEGWAYFALALLELLSHILPAAREDPNVFRIMDTVLAAASSIPLLFYMTFLYLLTRRELLPLLPNRFQRLLQLLLIIFIPAVLTFNTLGGFIGISRRIIHIGNESVLAIGFANQRDSMLWVFFNSLALALYIAFQAAVFVLVFYRLLRAFLDQRRIENADADEAHLYKGTGWISGAVKLGAIETTIGFVQEGFGGVMTRRILRLVARGTMVIGVFKGLDTAEDFNQIRRELSDNRGKGYQQSSGRQVISKPSAFRQLSPTATSFHAEPRAIDGQAGDAYAMRDDPGMQQFANVRDRRQRVTVVFSQGAPTLQMRFSALDLPSPATIVDRVKSPQSEWLSSAYNTPSAATFSQNNSITQRSSYSRELADQFATLLRPPPSAASRDFKGKQPTRGPDSGLLAPTPRWGDPYTSTSRSPSYTVSRPSRSSSVSSTRRKPVPTPSPALADDDHSPIDPLADEDEEHYSRERGGLGDDDWEQVDDDTRTHSTHVTQSQFADWHIRPQPEHMLQYLPPPPEIRKIQLQPDQRTKEAELARLAFVQPQSYLSHSRPPSQTPSPSYTGTQLFSSRPATVTPNTETLFGNDEDELISPQERVISTIAEVDEPSFRNRRTSAWVSSNGKSTEDVSSPLASPAIFNNPNTTTMNDAITTKRRPPPLQQQSDPSTARTRSRSRTIDSEDGTIATSKSTDALTIPWLRNLPPPTNNSRQPDSSISSKSDEQRRHEEQEAELARALGGSNLASKKQSPSQTMKIKNIGNAPMYTTPQPMPAKSRATSGVASLYIQPMRVPSRDSGLDDVVIEEGGTATSSSRPGTSTDSAYASWSKPSGMGIAIGTPPGSGDGDVAYDLSTRNEVLRRDSEVLPEANRRSYRRY